MRCMGGRLYASAVGRVKGKDKRQKAKDKRQKADTLIHSLACMPFILLPFVFCLLSSCSSLRFVAPARAFAFAIQLLMQVEAFEDQLAGGGDEAGALVGAEMVHGLAQAGNLLDPFE